MRVRAAGDSRAWRPDFIPPSPLATPAWRLTPLHPSLAEADFGAFSVCRERLRAELAWDGWPPEGFTLADNRADLARHFEEFERRQAYAYSVVDDPAVVGCVYIEPWTAGAQLHLWVTDASLSMERDVLERTLAWLGSWPFEGIIVPVRQTNPRLRGHVRALGLEPCEGPAGFESFAP